MPEWEEAVARRIRALDLPGAREAEIVEELSRHLDDRYHELLASGLEPQAARILALQELESHDPLSGGLRSTRRRGAPKQPPIGTTGGRNLMSGFWHDCKVAFRTLWTRPGFSFSVILILSLGVAANAAIFSIFNSLFLRPLPFAEPARLVDLDETAPKWNLKYVSINNPDFDNWQRANTTFDGMAFFSTGGANLSDSSGVAQRIATARVTYNLLDVLGLQPVIGRNFLPKEDVPNGPGVAMISYDLWERLFHRDPQIIGRVMRLSEIPHTVIGVLPREAILPPDTDLWTPLAADRTRGGSYYLSGVGRLKHGVTIDQARADLLRAHKSLMHDGQAVNADTFPVIQPLRDRYLGDVRTVMRILLGAVAMVLVIACVNIAGLMLVRGEARSREIAIRTAVGASRPRLVRQLLTESLLLSFSGGLIGAAGGRLALHGLVSLLPSDTPRWIQFNLDARFAVFCIALSTVAALVFGLAPALQAASIDHNGALQQSVRTTLAPGKRRILSGLVVCEIGLALMLLVASGLILQAFRKVLHVDPGFRPDNVITWNLRLPPAKYRQPPQQLAFFNSLVERLRTVPGVRSASAASLVPLGGHAGYFFEGENPRSSAPGTQRPVVLGITVLPGYLETMGMTLIAGQDITARDQAFDAPKVALVNEALAREFWGDVDVVGKRIRYAGNTRPEDWMRIAGVVRNTMHYGLDGEVRPTAFVPFPVSSANGMTIVLRTAFDPHSLISPARDVTRSLDPELPMFDIRTMGERLDRSLWVRRVYSWLFVAFAAVAIVLAAAGIYGVISFAVSQRTREIGIRMALGALPAQVLRGVMGSGMLLVAAGVLAGVIGSQFTARLLQSMLFGVDARDLWTYAVVVLGVAVIGLLANYIPARRAASVDPIHALRSE